MNDVGVNVLDRGDWDVAYSSAPVDNRVVVIPVMNGGVQALVVYPLTAHNWLIAAQASLCVSGTLIRVVKRVVGASGG